MHTARSTPIKRQPRAREHSHNDTRFARYIALLRVQAQQTGGRTHEEVKRQAGRQQEGKERARYRRQDIFFLARVVKELSG